MVNKGRHGAGRTSVDVFGENTRRELVRSHTCHTHAHAEWTHTTKRHRQQAPPGVWRQGDQPYFSSLMGMYTLRNVEKHCEPGLIPPNVHNVFMQCLWRYQELRGFFDNCYPKTMCHGDPHMGNFYIKKDKTIGTFDFQVLTECHPMRDVSYFLASSYDPDELPKVERKLIRFYLDKLKEFGVRHPPSFEDSWEMYRLWQWYTMYAFIFSGGFSNLMDPLQTNCGVARIVRTLERIDSAGALYAWMDGKYGKGIGYDTHRPQA